MPAACLCWSAAGTTHFLLSLLIALHVFSFASAGLFTALFGGEDPRYCSWHGTAPFCSPSCPAGKVKAEGRETKCGSSSIFCCLTGQKIVCCPKDFDFNTQPVIFAKLPPEAPTAP
ncbi:uncharacterized protein LOC129582293 [Paramacrobiotus metropolitanus]|uniref:uncharacterized protein LOC129582293 n=1 Tax=Paramacrobiotus metropolitanus TaxID=2943436 RepID=UPI0024460E4C|nr:uncharacterized protein LOC129582293 [Paramacrobiotus metropolitanus]XP_055329764.1 uncharacterized protein LOC129582293 [Paramacrobiotus metropolitanus]